ncbi:MAG TPA: four helix bundle protein [candidate division Zixibacteria bacterium]
MKNCNSKFKDDIKKRTYFYALEVMRSLEQLPKNDFSADIVAKQLLRSATSIGANIIEAQAAGSKRDFTNYLRYSLKSANESKFWIALLRDSGKLNRELSNSLLEEAKELANILGKSILTLKNKNL